MTSQPAPRRSYKIAVIGSGITGMAAAWHLHNTGQQITLYAGGERVGGHSHTFQAKTVKGEKIPVDTGFIVFNERTYPNLIALFRQLKVPTQPSNMSFGVSLDDGGYEYAGTDFWALFAQRRNFFSYRHWKMLFEIKRFHREAPTFLQGTEELTFGEYLAKGGYSDYFIRRHIVPMGAAIWSMSHGEMMGFPARTFIRFFANHGLLQVEGQPQWFTVTGGSIEYIKRLTAPYEHRIRHSAVTRVRRTRAGIMVEAEDSFAEFDQVVMACHADEALALLADPTDDERSVLGAFRFSQNRAVLHQDDSLMPVRDDAWASWNVISLQPDVDGAVSLTYWMNNLQDIDDDKPLFVSLNPPSEPAAELKLWEGHYTHPIFDQAAIAAQPSVPRLQGVGGIWYCGAWCGYGFHEDGLTAGLTVAEAISGIARPWQVGEMSNAAFHVWPAEPLVAEFEAGTKDAAQAAA